MGSIVKDIKCAICKDKQNLEILYPENFDIKSFSAKTFSARRTPDRLHYRFVRCKRCGLIFSNPVFPEGKINKLYKESEFTYFDEAEYLKETYWNYFKKLKVNNKNSKVLDIGCGNGFFLEKLKNMGYANLFGVEPGKKMVSQAPAWLRKNIKINVLKPGLFRNGTFDAVCFFHTLDHVYEPDVVVKNIYKLLKKDGKVLVIVHNTDGLSVKIFGEKSPIFDIEHIYLFNPKTLTRLFKDCGFRNIKIVNIKNNYPIIYWVRLVPFSLTIKNLILRFLNLTRLGNLSIALNAGNIGIIAQK